jgi:arylsulfatase A-like enzyme
VGNIGAGILGASLYLALFLLVAAQQFARYAHPAGLDLAIAGIAPHQAMAMLVRALAPIILVTNVVLLAFHLAAGFVLGVLADRFWRAVGARGGWALTPRVRWVLVTGCLLVIAALAFATVVVRYPFQYDHILNANGGPPRRIQEVLTRRVSPGQLDLVLWAVMSLLAVPTLLGTVRRRPVVAAILATATGLGVAGWSRAHATHGTNEGPNVVLILLESARPDYFSVNGFPRPTSPALDRLVADHGVTFTNAWAHANATVASVVTIMTSAYSHRHGMRSMFHSEEFARPGLPTLPALLRGHGYATRVVTDWDGDSTYFNDRALPGFDQYDVAEFGVINYVKQIYGQHFLFYALTDNALGHRAFAFFYRAGGGFAPGGGDGYYRERIASHLAELATSPRFFLTLFFADAHFNYRCPFPYYERFTDPGYEGINKYEARSNPLSPTGPEREARQIKGLYAGCINEMDDNVGFVVDTLRQLGLADGTILVITGDHGEKLPDRRSFRYGRNGAWLDPAEFHVPLVIAAPGLAVARRSVAAPARHLDVMPTILDLVGVPKPAGLEGTSLVPLMTGAVSGRTVDVFAETGFHWTRVRPPYLGYPPMTEVVTLRVDRDGVLIPRYFLRPECLGRIELARHRFIRTARYQLNYRPTVDGAVTQLYDLTADPGLEHDLIHARPDVAAELRGRLFAWALGNPALTLRDGRLATRDPRDDDRCAPRD